jgi:hypothetical protein
MYCYRVNGLTLSLPAPVIGLPGVSQSLEPDIALTWFGWRRPEEMPSACESGWAAIPLPNCQSSQLWSRPSPTGTSYLLRFGSVNFSEFLIAPGGQSVRAAWTNPLVERAHLLKLMLGPVLGLILRITHRLPLHAGAVAFDGRAFALLGPSGSGKSTLIASLLERGCSLLADDLIVVEDEQGAPVLHSGQSNLKLWPTSLEALRWSASEFPRVFPRASKRTVAITAASPCAATPLAAIFLLAPRRTTHLPVSLEKLTPTQALLTLLGQLYPPFLPVSPEEHRSLFPRLSRLATQVPIFQVERSDGFAALPALSRQIVQTAAATAA